MKTTISEFDFEYNPDLKEPKAIFPQLAQSSFVMQLQTQEQFYSARVMYDFVFKNINIEIYDQNANLAQIRVFCASGVNLFFLEPKYYLEWLPTQNKFVFSRVD